MPSLESLQKWVGSDVTLVLDGPHVAALGRGPRMGGTEKAIPPATPLVAQDTPDLDPTPTESPVMQA